MTDHACAENIDFHINVQQFGDTNLKYLEVAGACRLCGRTLAFRGPAGISPAHPTVAIDGGEAVLPCLFDGETYDGKAAGYSVTSPGAN